ncbi:MAG: glycosyltransferase [Phycisphaerae bacterium]|nr:glycosyltransferase [Phycisphaerae bacterium]
MSERIADALVLAFSEGVGLRTWAEAGLLEREWSLYERLRASFGRIVLATQGGPEDAQIGARFGPGVTVVCNAAGLSPGEYAGWLGVAVAEALAGAGRALVKTNQMSGGDVAIGIVDRLRAGGVATGLLARGGYLWSQFEAWERGAGSPAAVSAGEREARLCRAADVVVGTTPEMVDALSWRFGLSEDRVAVIPNYVDVEGLGEPPERSRTEVLFAGRLVPQKRVDRVIAAMGMLRDDLKARAELTIVGDGPLRAELESQARAAGVRTTFVPRLPHDEVLGRMRRCLVYAQASAFEGHPKTILEAMALGTTVLACDAPGVRGMIRHCVTGMLVSPEPEAIALALEGLLDDPEWCRSLGDSAESQVRTAYAVETIAAQERTAMRRVMERARIEGGAVVNAASAVRFDAALTEAPVASAVEAWTRALRGFARRLDPKTRAKFVMGLDAPLYELQGQAAVEADGGLHPKHRLMRYHDFFVERIGTGERVIDLGCGVGALAASIAERSGARVTGMDWAEANLDKARRIAEERRLGGRIEYVLGDITKDRATGAFDVVVLSNVLEHVEGRAELLRRWREWYGAGRFLIRVPAFDREWRVPFKRELGVEWRLDDTHATEYTREQLEAELASAGLKVEELRAVWGEYWVKCAA